LRFETCRSGVDETAIKGTCAARAMTPDETALVLANAKAAAVVAPGALVIGADQLLVLDGVSFDKPEDMADARQHLMNLRGKTHRLHTAVVFMRDGETLWHHVARPALTMRSFSESFLDDYLASEGEAILACVGAYRLEGAGIHLFERIEGDYSAILGLPLLPLLGSLRALGIVHG
jgi:septum formation protein